MAWLPIGGMGILSRSLTQCDPFLDDLDEIFAALLDRFADGDDAAQAGHGGTVLVVVNYLVFCEGKRRLNVFGEHAEGFHGPQGV